MHANVVQGKDGSVGFSVLVFSEDYSLVLLDKPTASSSGVLRWSSIELSYFSGFFGIFLSSWRTHMLYFALL